MSILMILAAVSLQASGDSEPLYVLESPGMAFGYLAEEMDPPLEGVLDEESGSITSGPNSSGIEYRLYYWRQELDPNLRRGDWLTERLASILPPDQAEMLVLGDITWAEGSMLSPYRETSSIGLMPSVNFNLVDEQGNVLGMGRATAAFRNGYSVLFYGLAPFGTLSGVREELDGMVAYMYLVESGG